MAQSNAVNPASLKAMVIKGYRDGLRAGRIKALSSAVDFQAAITKLVSNLFTMANSLQHFNGEPVQTVNAIRAEGKKQEAAIWMLIVAFKQFFPNIEGLKPNTPAEREAVKVYQFLQQAHSAAFLMKQALDDRTAALSALRQLEEQLMASRAHSEKFTVLSRREQGIRKPRSKPVDLDGIADKLDDAVTATLGSFLHSLTHVQYTLTTGDIFFSIVMPAVIKDSNEPLFKKQIWPRVIQAIRQAGFNAAIFKRYEVQGSGDGRLYFTIPAIDRAITENGIRSLN